MPLLAVAQVNVTLVVLSTVASVGLLVKVGVWGNTGRNNQDFSSYLNNSHEKFIIASFFKIKF